MDAVTQQTWGPGIRRVEGRGGLPFIEVDTPLARASLCLQGAHLTHFQAQGQAPLLWLSPEARWEPRVPIRGGIPVCWPWFGPSTDPSTLPLHGFARILDWTLLGCERRPDHGVRISLALESGADSRALWNHGFHARLDVELGRELHVLLTVRNTDTEAWPMQAGFHPYFSTGGTERLRLRGLGRRAYQDRAAGAQRHVKAEEDRIWEGALDVLYFDAPPRVELEGAPGGRRITIATEGAPHVVVWNPGPDRSFDDLASRHWKEFVCVEPLNAHVPHLLAPGGTVRLGMRLGTETMDPAAGGRRPPRP